MTSACWTVRIERMRLDLAVGVHAHERAPQPVALSLVLKGRAGARPVQLADCLDYEPLLDWLRATWAASPHRGLLEERIDEVVDACFALDVRIDSVWVGLYKLALGADAVGLERAVTRREHRAAAAAGARAPLGAVRAIDRLAHHADAA